MTIIYLIWSYVLLSPYIDKSQKNYLLIEHWQRWKKIDDKIHVYIHPFNTRIIAEKYEHLHNFLPKIFLYENSDYYNDDYQVTYKSPSIDLFHTEGKIEDSLALHYSFSVEDLKLIELQSLDANYIKTNIDWFIDRRNKLLKNKIFLYIIGNPIAMIIPAKSIEVYKYPSTLDVAINRDNIRSIDRNIYPNSKRKNIELLFDFLKNKAFSEKVNFVEIDK
jgi:hypothetical protein